MHGCKGALIAVLALGAMGALVGRAAALTAEGTLLTNVACGTYSSPQATPYEVSYCVTATVVVGYPNLQIRKTAAPTLVCSGETVTYCIVAVNQSRNMSAFNVALRDLMPAFSPYVYINPSYTAWVSNAATTITRGHGKPPPFLPTYTWEPIGPPEPPDGQGGAYEVRWNLNELGPTQSVYICFQVLIL